MAVRWHWLQQKVLEGTMQLHHLRTKFQVADILTKAVDHGTFARLSDVIQGHVPVWEYGDGALRRALDPANTLTPEGLARSNEHARAAREAAQRPTTLAQEQAALMYGAHYSGDVTGDGATSVIKRGELFGSADCCFCCMEFVGGKPSGGCICDCCYRRDPSIDDSNDAGDDGEPVLSLVATPVDGNAQQRGTEAQEQAAMMYGARYSGDVTGDGAGSNPAGERFGSRSGDGAIDRGEVFWPDLTAIAALLYPDEPSYTNVITLRGLQLAANVMGGGEHAPEALIRHLAPAPEDMIASSEDIIAQGVRDLEHIISATTAMVFITANRTASNMFGGDMEELPSAPSAATTAQLVGAVQEVLARQGLDSRPQDIIELLPGPPAEPFIPQPPPAVLAPAPGGPRLNVKQEAKAATSSPAYHEPAHRTTWAHLINNGTGCPVGHTEWTAIGKRIPVIQISIRCESAQSRDSLER
jgi:hypothetical protein